MKDRVMLGLKDSNGGAGCEYESRSIIVAPKKPKSGRKGRSSAKSRRNANSPKSSCLIAKGPAKKGKKEPVPEEASKSKNPVNIIKQESPKYKPPEPIVFGEVLTSEQKPLVMKDDTSDLFGSPEQNEENSKAFMESIGSWINDLFSTPNKRNPSPKNEKEVLNKELASPEDVEYLKSISAITEQFKKKLKTETTVHISVPETPFELNFDNILDNHKKQKKRAKTQPPENKDWLAEFNDNFNVPTLCLPRQHNSNPHASALVIRTAEAEAPAKPLRAKNSLEPNSFELLREKKKGKNKLQNRRGVGEMDEHVFPRAGELSKKILLNVSDQEKFAQFYKNTHLAAQDYGQRKSKTYQSNTRCYTTKAKGRGKFSAGSYSPANRASHYSSTPAILPKGLGEVLRNNPLDYKRKSFRNASRKALSELTRDPMSFSKMRSGGAFPTIQETRSEVKASSDDLVKYLMKKLKTTRPHLMKKRGRTKVDQILGGVKNRFMQSATSSLVTTVLSRKEHDSHLNSKSSPRLFTGNRIFPTKELMLKQSDTAMKLDMARAMSGKFSKTSYLLESEKQGEDEFLSENGRKKGAKQSYDEILRREFIKSEKYSKRQEVKRMLSNLDMKEVFQACKAQAKKEQMKKQTPPEEPPDDAGGEWQNARFQKQHELFKKSLKASGQPEQTEMADGSVEGDNENNLREMEQEPSEGISPSNEAAEPNQQFLSSEEQEQKKTTEQGEEEANSVTFVSKNQQQDRRETETFSREKDKSPLMKAEKKIAEKSPREKGRKVKSPLKHSESKSLMNPLMELCSDENQPPSDPPKSYAVPIPPKELRNAKGTESLLINRRYSTNSVKKDPKGHKSIVANRQVPSVCFLQLEKDTDKNKDEKQDKKESKAPASTSTEAQRSDTQCGFENEKVKPGPDCSNEA